MPITQCKIHGESGIVEMCEHLYNDLEKGIYQTPIELPIKTTRMCSNCFEKYGVQEILDFIKLNIDSKEVEQLRSEQGGVWSIAPKSYFEADLLEEKNPYILKKINFIYNEIAKNRGWKCTSCIDQIRLDFARKNKLKLPFKPYENTLMDEEDKRISKLEKKLENYINPKKLPFSIENKKWFDIDFGSLRKPFTININGVEVKEEQQKILNIIDKFFQNITEKQRTVIFRKPLNWVKDNQAEYSKSNRC